MFPVIPPGDSGQSGPSQPLAQQLKMLQIIRGAVIAGPLFFLPIALLLCGKPLNFDLGLLEVLALAMVGSISLVYVLVGQQPFIKDLDAIRQATPEDRENALAAAVVKKEIVRGALLEGPTFYCFILILINGSLVGLTLGLVLSAVSAVLFPTPNRFRNQVDALKFKLGL